MAGAAKGRRGPAPQGFREPILAGMLISISLCHYFVGFRFEQLHDIFARLYYLPIILGAFWFGRRGGLGAAFAAAALFLPHVFFQWRVHAEHGHFNQYVEMCMFLVVGLVTGFFADSEKTQRARAEDAFNKLEESFDRAKRAEALAAVGQLSAGIAHEVRNPLAGIKGALEILLSDVKPGDDKYRFVEIANKETERLESLVTEFLQYAKPRAPEMAPCGINDIARSVVEFSGKHLRDNKAEVTLELDESVPVSFMDEAQVKQVALNLLLNAVQAMPGGGRVTITTRKSEGEIILEVADTGEGISAGCEESIFEPFYTTRQGGTGLGLAVSRRIINTHGGQLTARCDEGGGAVFTMSLPILTEAPADA